MKIGRLLIACAFMGSLSACGFAPLYKETAQSQRAHQSLASIEIMPKKDRTHQLMRNKLLYLMGENRAPLYQLNISPVVEKLGFGIRQDASASQERLTLTVDYSLVDLSSLEKKVKILSGQLSRSTSYQLVQSDYATLVRREDSIERLAEKIAEDLHLKLLLHFKQGE
ncbi:LPS assembly lipoprotein LptE [Temperatibacter marinus]|uniref:LPS assembly lipoprotein LptE n=1 Tax=Temperatibacter marinus TaxID=1456591 RepID=A0AA52HBJ1_9PROT|nr:LPS assembly lipoprotein LptE [Temperatibacter marinus]WND03698.1 LPS assembly lipoprotein LptE [Temperatibacter marinus]